MIRRHAPAVKPQGAGTQGAGEDVRDRLLTDIEGGLGLHGGGGCSYNAPAEDEEAQPCGRSHLCDDKVTRHLEYQVPQREDACNSSLHDSACQSPNSPPKHDNSQGPALMHAPECVAAEEIGH